MAQVGNITLTPTKIQQILEAGRRQLSAEEFEELTSLLFDLEIYGFTPWINVKLGTLMSKIRWELEIEPSPEWEEALIACDRAFLGRELRDMCEDAGVSPMGHKKQLCAKLYRRKVPEVVEVMEPYLKKMPKVTPVTPEVTAQLKEGAGLEGSLFGGSRDISRLRFAEKDAPIRKIMKATQDRYNELRVIQGLEPVTDWAKRPAITLEQKYRQILAIPKAERLPQTQHLWVSKMRDIKDRLEEIYRMDPDEFYHRKKIIEQAIKERERGKTKTIPDFTLEELRDLLKFTKLLYR